MTLDAHVLLCIVKMMMMVILLLIKMMLTMAVAFPSAPSADPLLPTNLTLSYSTGTT